MRKCALWPLLVIALVACTGRPEQSSPRPSTNEAWYAAIDEADALNDPLARCLAYPDPPGYQWPKALVHALCSDFKRPVVEADQVRARIDAKDWSGLRELYNGYLRRHYARTDPEQLLYRAFPRTSWRSAREADDYTARWLAAAPEDPYANTLRAKVLIEQAWDVRGIEYAIDVPSARMARTVQIAEEAGRLAEKALKLEPKLLPAYQQVLKVAALTGNHERFRATLEASLRQSPDNYQVRATALQFLVPKWGGSAAEMDQLVEDAQSYLSANPRLTLLRARRVAFDASRFAQQRQFGPAMDVYRRAVALGPEPTVVQAAAYAAVESGRQAEAVVYLSQSIRFSKRAVWALVQRGSAWESMGEFRRAMRSYEEAAELTPADASIPFRMAALQHKRQDFAEADQYYLRSLELDPDNADVIRNACRMWVHLTLEPRKAMPYAERLVELRPDDPESWLLLANVQHSLGHPATMETAKRFLSMANPEDPRWKDSVQIIHRFLDEQSKVDAH